MRVRKSRSNKRIEPDLRKRASPTCSAAHARRYESNMKPRHLVFYLFFLTLLPGCNSLATVDNANHFRCDDCTIPRVYSGVSHIACLWSTNYKYRGLAVLDMPFSLVADTALLPYTIYTQVRYGNICNKKVESE